MAKERVYVVTGSASGIGASTVGVLRGWGARVVGVDLRDAEVLADLSSETGRRSLYDAVKTAAGDTIDGIISCAGVVVPEHLAVAVDYFGAVATVDELLPLLEESAAPRIVAVTSVSMLGPVDDQIVQACLDGDESTAVTAAAGSGNVAYASAKRALGRWVRRRAPELAKRGILINGVAPGVVRTPTMAPAIDDEQQRAILDQVVPMPVGRYAEPIEIASLLAYFAGPANTMVTGQVIFADGGADTVLRPDDIW